MPPSLVARVANLEGRMDAAETARAIINIAINHAWLLIDSQGQVIDSSWASKLSLGYYRHELIGTFLFDLMLEGEYMQDLLLQLSDKPNQSTCTPVHFYRRDGTRIRRINFTMINMLDVPDIAAILCIACQT